MSHHGHKEIDIREADQWWMCCVVAGTDGKSHQQEYVRYTPKPGH